MDCNQEQVTDYGTGEVKSSQDQRRADGEDIFREGVRRTADGQESTLQEGSGQERTGEARARKGARKDVREEEDVAQSRSHEEDFGPQASGRVAAQAGQSGRGEAGYVGEGSDRRTR